MRNKTKKRIHLLEHRSAGADALAVHQLQVEAFNDLGQHGRILLVVGVLRGNLFIFQCSCNGPEYFLRFESNVHNNNIQKTNKLYSKDSTCRCSCESCGTEPIVCSELAR